MDEDTLALPVKLANGTIIYVEARGGGEEQVRDRPFTFDAVTQAVEGVCAELAGVFDRMKPTRAEVTFGVEANMETGKLTAMIVKGGAKANLAITLEWQRPS